MLKDMDKWISIRRRVLGKEISKRQACLEYGIGWRTLEKVLTHEEPPGYRQRQPRRKPKLEPFLPIIHGILEADQQAPKKQQHTATATHLCANRDFNYKTKLPNVSNCAADTYPVDSAIRAFHLVARCAVNRSFQ